MRLLKRLDGRSFTNAVEHDLLEKVRFVSEPRKKGKSRKPEPTSVFGRERCGWLNWQDEIREVENINPSPGRFEFPPFVTISLYEFAGKPEGPKALWHTHPNGNDDLSEADIASHPAFIRFSIIVNPITGIVSWWEMR
jgi:proteasome lid subunit RPN8/RPN11